MTRFERAMMYTGMAFTIGLIAYGEIVLILYLYPAIHTTSLQALIYSK